MNDRYSLHQPFYRELLHIAGLVEIREKNRKVIARAGEGERNPGSLLENTIGQMEGEVDIHQIPDIAGYGQTHDERLFNLAMELCITWVNRLLFLKLLEARLTLYHNDDQAYSFLNMATLSNYAQLNDFFFGVPAVQPADRTSPLQEKFPHIPFLNSSLFQPELLEQKVFFISGLDDDLTLPVYSQSVLKNANGSRMKGELPTLEYLFRFLEAWDFGNGGREMTGKDFGTSISASVLGLIFEKINGYRDGAVFTPGHITMFMSRSALESGVVQKFNQVKGWQCKDFSGLEKQLSGYLTNHPVSSAEGLVEANHIINSIRIIDPAVGSGHFLVSCLNELIAIKYRLGILQDRNGNPLQGCKVEVVHDELVVSMQKGKTTSLFRYIPGDDENQRIQETLFHEKQTLIENCLFGVDINPGSVKICRLRLWIELLKNAYYQSPSNSASGSPELQPLPNVEPNIRCGNSLVSRFPFAGEPAKVADNNPIYQHAFEWKQEFPQLVVSQGNFTGFDVCIGNPPYGVKISSNERNYYKKALFNSGETAILFIHRGRQLLKDSGILSFIVPKPFAYASNYAQIRKVLKDELTLIVDCHKPWPDVKLEAVIFQAEKHENHKTYDSLIIRDHQFTKLNASPKILIDEFGFILNGINDAEITLARKIRNNNLFLGDISTNQRGSGLQKQLRKEGNYEVLGGIDIERLSIRGTRRGFLQDISTVDEQARIRTNSVLVQNIVAHLTRPTDHIKIIAAIPPSGNRHLVILDTINQITFRDDVSDRFGCHLLNSRIINWYVYNFIFARAVRTMHFDNVVTCRIPFPGKYFDNRPFYDHLPSLAHDRIFYDLFDLQDHETALVESTFKKP